jgi:hypothetical protein
MGWPVPSVPDGQEPSPPSPWFIVALCVVCLVVGTALTLLLWPTARGTAGNFRFWTCLAGLPAVVAVILVAALFHLYGMQKLYRDCWDDCCKALDRAWRAWARRHVALTAFSTLTPESDLAERIAGLAGEAPKNKTKVLTLEGFDSDFRANRIESVLNHLIERLKPALDELRAEQTVRALVLTGSQAEGEAIRTMTEGLWRRLDIRPHIEVTPIAELRWTTIEDYAVRERTPLLILCAQLHDAGAHLQQFTEAATGLLLEHAVRRTRDGLPAVRIFRSIPTAIESFKADLAQLGEMGPVELAKLRIGWSCGLGKAERYALEEALVSGRIVLKGGSKGITQLDDCIGPTGPINPWLSLGLAAELVQYGQGAQLLAVQDGNRVRMAVADALTPTVTEARGGDRTRDLRGAATLICAAPWIAILLAVIFRPVDTFPWIMAGIASAVLLTLLLLLLHPVMVESRAARDVEAAGGRLPVDG